MGTEIQQEEKEEYESMKALVSRLCVPAYVDVLSPIVSV